MSLFKFNLSNGELNDGAALMPYRDLSNKKFANAYTSQEIVSFLNYKIKNGGL